MSSGRLIAGALAAACLGVGVIVGLAAPRDGGDASAETTADPALANALSQVDARDAWLAEVGERAASGRIEGMSVALVVADGATDDEVQAVRDALALGGARIAVTGHLGEAWWDPHQASFRAGLADELRGSVVGADDASAPALLQHAIVQALVPGAALSDPGESPPSADAPVDVAGDGADTPAQVLRDALERAEILTVDGTGAGDGAVGAPSDDGAGVDAVVIVAAAGPDGAGAVAASSASVWEQYVGASLVVVAAGPDAASAPVLAADAIATAAQAQASSRPSVVVTTASSLLPAQVVLALAEQRDGGSGSYGAFDGMATLPSG